MDCKHRGTKESFPGKVGEKRVQHFEDLCQIWDWGGVGRLQGEIEGGGGEGRRRKKKDLVMF